MNITQETNNYFSTTSTGETKTNSTVISWPKEKKLVTKAFPTPEQILEDKFRTAPDRGLTKISKTFTIDWKKLSIFFGFR